MATFNNIKTKATVWGGDFKFGDSAGFLKTLKCWHLAMPKFYTSSYAGI